MTEYVWTLFGQGGAPSLSATGLTDATVGMQFSLSQDARVTGIWMYSPSSATVLPPQIGVFNVATQTLILGNMNPVWSGAAGSGWVKCSFDGSFQLLAGTNYDVAMYATTGDDVWASTSGFWESGGVGENGLTNGIVSAPSQSASVNGQAPAATTSGIGFPSGSQPGINYWIDIEVTTGIPAPSSPVPGFGMASPRSWNPGDEVTTPRLRADLYNLAALAGQGRPLFEATASGSVAVDTVTVLSLNEPVMNSWNTVLTQGAALSVATAGTANFYPVPLAGWYLMQGWAGQAPVSGGATDTLYSWGMIYNQGTATIATRTDLGEVAGQAAMNDVQFIGNSGAELVPLTPVSGDILGPYAATSNSTGTQVQSVWSAEWVGLPGTTSINGVPYTGPVGTVVTTLKPATLWPPGPGGTLNAAVSAGGSVLALGPVPGLRAGGTIGVDWLAGQQYQPYAETATVASVAGGTVTLSGTLSFAHLAGAPVAIPVSAALLNEQIRDQVNFWCYPPMLRAVQGTASPQSIPSGTWTTVSLALSGAGIVNTLDNFSGWATVTANSYTIPVSGLYLCIGQVYYAGSTSSADWGAALIDNDGNRYQGDFMASDATGGAVVQAPAVRRLLRLTAGQTIALQTWQSTGSSVDTDPRQTVNLGSILLTLPRLLIILRAL